MVRKYGKPGTFVPITGFEWHSTSLGDYHILYPYVDGEYVRFDDLRQFQQFAQSNEMLFTGDFPRESAMLHRLVFHDHYQTAYKVSDVDEGKDVNWYYLRVVQANEQFAWSSPIWVEAKTMVNS